MEYLPTLGLFKITLGVNVGKYSIHGSSGIYIIYLRNLGGLKASTPRQDL